MGGAIWLASYPKSGNTWARLALLSLSNGGAPASLGELGGFAPMLATNPNLDRLLQVESGHLTEDEIEALRPDLNRELFAGPEPRPCKVHDAWTRAPDGRPLFDADVTHAAIYLVRDPRDIAVSWSRFAGVGIDRAVAMLADPGAELSSNARAARLQLRQRLKSWSRHVTSWLDESGFDPLLIRYEDMLEDPAREIARMAAHMGWAAEPQAVAGAVEATRFEELAEQERRHGFRERMDRTERFFHTGRSGGWRELLSADQAARIERDHGEVMARLGYR
ncbi:sulfotransferase domain-containing protein [Sphingomonas sp.]|uniref:sulfotransferase domain-containing protein n=1 Tax=Sphingomonas sp. TaxID=28214 RepID=UPI001B030CA9|nr:sulfotransferase domain-containing protein [Sphingomonas sp.]MBO9712354.1 sulfotransferase domain-containing protein [Sphingomonas sp.]